MTKKGAQFIIESLSLRVFEIEDIEERLAQEKAANRARIRELEQVEDEIIPTPIINIGQP